LTTAAETETRFRVLAEMETCFCFLVLITMAAVGVTTAAATETGFRVLAETETRFCFLVLNKMAAVGAHGGGDGRGS
jgi:hypothetical protein